MMAEPFTTEMASIDFGHGELTGLQADFRHKAWRDPGDDTCAPGWEISDVELVRLWLGRHALPRPAAVQMAGEEAVAHLEAWATNQIFEQYSNGDISASRAA